VLDPQGKIDRKSLASVVFKDARALATLNSILHPLVKQHFTEWVGLHHRSPYVIQEAAIIFESGIEKEYDHIIHVSCPKEIAIGRVRKRDGTDDEAVLERMRFQIPDQEKTALSDFVILNNGTELVIPQVLRIHRILSERSAKGNDDVSARTAYT
jgi:dephospho-CoA kinase